MSEASDEPSAAGHMGSKDGANSKTALLHKILASTLYYRLAAYCPLGGGMLGDSVTGATQSS